MDNGAGWVITEAGGVWLNCICRELNSFGIPALPVPGNLTGGWGDRLEDG